VTINDAGVVVRLTDSLCHDYTKHPLVTTIADYFVQQAHGMKRVVDAKNAAAATEQIGKEMKAAADLMAQQQEQLKQHFAEQAKMAQEVVRKADEEEARAKRNEAQAKDDEAFVRTLLQKEKDAAARDAELKAAQEKKDAEVARSLAAEEQKASHTKEAASDTSEQERKDAAMARQLAQEEKDAAARDADQRAAQERQDAEIARKLDQEQRVVQPAAPAPQQQGHKKPQRARHHGRS
jgi:colicin import membrane protein